MKCQTTTNSTPTLNKSKRIGTIVLFVEGEKTEIALFKKIFCGILGYKSFVVKRRGNKSFASVYGFSPADSNAANIFLFNLRESRITSINDDKFRNKLYAEVLTVYNIDLRNKPVYYIWDRDHDSNPAEDVKKLVERLGSANGNTIDNPKQDYENGLLILSYPAVESYIISNLKPAKTVIGVKLKKHLKREKLSIKNLSEHSLIKAAKNMHARMEELGVIDYDTDNFSKPHSLILEKEDAFYEDNACYLILSLISVVLIDLGVIEF